jgi:hypothetical protein
LQFLLYTDSLSSLKNAKVDGSKRGTITHTIL